MKKYVLLLFIILFLPLMVKAEDKNIVLEAISLNEKSDNVVEINPATIEDNKLVLDFKMYEVDDYIEYKVKVKNNTNETLEVDQSNLVSSSNYVKYTITGDNSIKGKEEKEILLRITYQNKVENKDFFSAKYINQDKIPIVFKSPTIINPETIRNILPIILIISLMVGYSIYNKKKINLSKAIILLLLLGLIPNIASALEEEIILESNIMIRKVKPIHCTFDGEMVQGAEYTNGQYTYRYMQEYGGGTTWTNIGTDGWGVTLTDKDSTEDVTSTLCSTINEKPLVSTRQMFYGSKTNSLDTSSFDTQEVVNMTAMFGETSTLADVDISYFDTSKVTDMTAMFWKGLGFTELDLSSFDTSNVTNMSYMFEFNPNLTRINLKGLNTSKVTDMNVMFYGDTSLVELDLSGFDTSNVTGMAALFYDCSSLVKLNLDNWDLSNVTNLGILSGTLYGTSSLKEISCKNWILPVIAENGFFRILSGANSPIEKIDVTGWDLSKTTSILGLFADGANLKEIIGLDTWDTSNIENMTYVFDNCSSITTLNLSTFDTSKVTSMFSMVGGCTSLEKLDISNFDFSNYNPGALMMNFSSGGFSNLKTLVLDNVVLPQNMNYGFGGLSTVKNISFNNVDTSNVTKMDVMFDSDSSLTSLDLSSFDTSNVTDMYGMFQSCSSLTSLDLSSFDTSNVTYTTKMFSSCTSLTTAYGRTQVDCDKFNSSSEKPSNVNFVVKA